MMHMLVPLPAGHLGARSYPWLAVMLLQKLCSTAYTFLLSSSSQYSLIDHLQGPGNLTAQAANIRMLLFLHAHVCSRMSRAQFSEAEVQAARRLLFSAAAAHCTPRPHRGKRKAPGPGGPSPGHEAPRPAKRPKPGGRGAKPGSAGKRPSAPAGSASPEANAAAQGDAGSLLGLTPGPGEAGAAGDTAAEGGEAGESKLGREGGDGHASHEQPAERDADSKPRKAAGGAKRRHREGDADAAQEPATAMCGPAFSCT